MCDFSYPVSERLNRKSKGRKYTWNIFIVVNWQQPHNWLLSSSYSLCDCVSDIKQIRPEETCADHKRLSFLRDLTVNVKLFVNLKVYLYIFSIIVLF